MEKEKGYSEFGSLTILRDHLKKNDIICHPLIDYLSGNISPHIFTPSFFLPGTNILKIKLEVVN